MDNNIMNMKRCTKCGEVKEASTEYFHRQKKGKYGLRAECKVCRNKYQKKWHEVHVEYVKDYHKQYYKDNKDRDNERSRRWYEGHKEYCNEYSRQYHKENRGHRNEYGRQWAKNNQDKRNTHRAKRRARKLNQTPSDANKEKIALVYKMCSTMDGYHVDHIKPLSKGGQHHENNLQILKASLNMEKHDKWPLTKEELIKYKGIKL